MKSGKNYKFETLAVHAGHAVDPATGAVTEPIHLSTTFERDADGGYSKGFLYSRNHNPNRNGLEAALAALEGGAAAAAFSSGLAAVTAIFQGLSPGDHVIAPSDIYHGTANVLKHLFGKWKVTASFIDMTNLDVVRQTLTPNTRIIWIETPSNPLLQCVDIAALAEIAHAHGARAIADNTFASPVLQQPLALGCDMVMHATTKYLGGRSDVLGGAVVSRLDDEAFAQLRMAQLYGGAVPSPFSRPTDTRSRPCGVLLSGPSIDARCSIRLSTPPRLVARVKMSTLAASAIAASLPPLTSKDSMPPKPDICFLASA